MTAVWCSPDPKLSAKASKSGAIGVTLYGRKGGNLGGIGNRLPEAFRQLGRQPSELGWDFLSIALGVSAADTFVRRSLSANGWCRDIQLTIGVNKPKHWAKLTTILTKALRFLSEDNWTLNFIEDKYQIAITNIDNPSNDCVALLSGGLDSLIGAIDLLSNKRTPLLVSYSYPKDGQIQSNLVSDISQKPLLHFQGNADPKWEGRNETSMRCRSFVFIAYGVAIATSQNGANGHSGIELFVPENGLISLNVPLTPRRIGSLSTRTTHPYFMKLIHDVLEQCGFGVKLVNPYQFVTKGEMLMQCKNPSMLAKVASASVSCGKWKRSGTQCGRCVPCIIRRAAFYRSGNKDKTSYRFPDLRTATTRDDIIAFQIATLSHSNNVYRHVRRAGPLPDNLRHDFCNVYSRGMDEVRLYLKNALKP